MLKFITSILFLALIVLGILVAFSFVSIPGNYKIYTVQSGSMEPSIHTGSLIFVKPMANYVVGDIVTRGTDDPKITITHRIISKEEKGGQTYFETKGDANNAPDGEKFTQEIIIGKLLFGVPLVGYVVSYAKTPVGLLLLIITPAFIIIFDEMRKIWLELKKIAEKRNTRQFYEKYPKLRP